MAASPDRLDPDGDEFGGGIFADINVTPLVDVMLVLLVIFMIAAPLMVKGVPVDLPRSGGTSLGRPATPIIVSITHDGSLYLRDEKIAPHDFPDRLRALRTDRGDAVIYVRADRGIAYGNVIDIIALFGTGGFTHVSMLSQPAASVDAK